MEINKQDMENNTKTFENFNVSESSALNTMVLDTVDSIHKTIEALKKDTSVSKADADQLFALAGPLVKQLHKFVK